MSKKKLDFRIDEYVVYPAHGVGKVTAVDEQEVAGITLELFVVAFDKDKMTLRVPTHKAIEVGMRPLATPDVVAHAMAILRGKAKVKRAMWSRRAQEYEQKINSGDLIAIAEVVRDLHRTDDQREQSYSERQLYEAALERLTREIAVVNGAEESTAGSRNHRCVDVACGSGCQLERGGTPPPRQASIGLARDASSRGDLKEGRSDQLKRRFRRIAGSPLKCHPSAHRFCVWQWRQQPDHRGAPRSRLARPR